MSRPDKYVALRKHLEMKAKEIDNTGDEPSLIMTFAEIEACLGFSLPASAYEHRAWWSNNTDKVWDRASFRTRDVDMTRRTVTFEYSGPLSSEYKDRRDARMAASNARVREVLAAKLSLLERLRRQSGEEASSPGMSETARSYAKNQVHPAYGLMRGLIRIVAGTDLTKAADPDWGDKTR